MKKLDLKTIMLWAALSLAWVTGLGMPAITQEIGQCWNNAQINQAVGRRDILPLATVLMQAGRGNNPNVLNAQVCQILGQPYYILDVLDAYGMTKQLILRGSDGASYN